MGWWSKLIHSKFQDIIANIKQGAKIEDQSAGSCVAQATEMSVSALKHLNEENLFAKRSYTPRKKKITHDFEVIILKVSEICIKKTERKRQIVHKNCSPMLGNKVWRYKTDV